MHRELLERVYEILETSCSQFREWPDDLPLLRNVFVDWPIGWIEPPDLPSCSLLDPLRWVHTTGWSPSELEFLTANPAETVREPKRAWRSWVSGTSVDPDANIQAWCRFKEVASPAGSCLNKLGMKFQLFGETISDSDDVETWMHYLHATLKPLPVPYAREQRAMLDPRFPNRDESCELQPPRESVAHHMCSTIDDLVEASIHVIDFTQIQDSSPPPDASTESVKLFGAEKSPVVNGKKVEPLPDKMYEIVKVLANHHPERLTKDRLDHLCDTTNARQRLKTLANKSTEWGGVLLFPKRRGDGYGIR